MTAVLPGPIPAVSRRVVLTASAAALPLLLAACKGVQALGTPPPPSLDIRVLRAAIAAEEEMVANYTAAVRTFQASIGSHSSNLELVTQAGLARVRAEHVQHLAQLKPRLIEAATGARAHSAAKATLPTEVNAMFAALESAEQTASDRLISQLAAVPPSLAQLLASIAASEATHVPYLRMLAKGRR